MVKYYIRTINKDETYTEKECPTLDNAYSSKKEGEKIHICRHDTGEPCILE